MNSTVQAPPLAVDALSLVEAVLDDARRLEDQATTNRIAIESIRDVIWTAS